jgi:hypothetical protein
VNESGGVAASLAPNRPALIPACFSARVARCIKNNKTKALTQGTNMSPPNSQAFKFSAAASFALTQAKPMAAAELHSETAAGPAPKAK